MNNKLERIENAKANESQSIVKSRESSSFLYVHDVAAATRTVAGEKFFLNTFQLEFLKNEPRMASPSLHATQPWHTVGSWVGGEEFFPIFSPVHFCCACRSIAVSIGFDEKDAVEAHHIDVAALMPANYK